MSGGILAQAQQRPGIINAPEETGILARLMGMFRGGPAPMEADLQTAQGGIDPTSLPPGHRYRDDGVVVDQNWNPVETTRRPNVLPLTRDAQTGEMQFAMPRMAELAGETTPSAVGSALAPVARAGETVLGSGPIRAYHGSPHDFDRFDLSKIGTGEGAQAYGHGLYFAESEGVARSYRDALSAQVPQRQAVPLQTEASRINNQIRALESRMIDETIQKYGRPKDADEWGDLGIAPAPEIAAKYQQEMADLAARAAAAQAEAARTLATPHAGRMYEVAIHADPERFLDWDKPLREQHGDARDALAAVVGWRNAPDGVEQLPSGRWVLKSGGEVYGRPDGWPDRSTAEYAMQSMQNEAGRIKDKTAGELLTSGGGSLGHRSMALADAGLPGIRYLDAGSRGAGDGSRNLVVFNDQIVEILRKYGMAGLALLPPAVAAQVQEQMQQGEAPAQ